MANQGAKRRLESNQRRLQQLRIAIIFSFSLFALVRALILRSMGTWHYVGCGLVAVSCWFCYSAIARAAQPIYSASGELIDGGSDLDIGGMLGYYHDWVYISCFTLSAAGFHSYFWWTFSVVPLYGLYKLVVNVVVPMMSGAGSRNFPDPADLDPATRKKLAKAEARAERRQAKSMSRR